jgi:hypothetical protein
MCDNWLVPGFQHSETWRALAHEADLAAEHIAFGVTVLGQANYTHIAYYFQAFFSLSIGFERTCKLALLLDYAIDHGGMFPTEKAVRSHGHNLKRLLSGVDHIANRRGFQHQCPSTPIHQGVISTLSEFAANLTRYYNIDFLTGAAQAAGRDDPIISWNSRVTEPILKAHYKERFKGKHERDALALEMLAGYHMRLKYTNETGEPINTAFEVARSSAMAKFARRWERRYVLQIARFIGTALRELGDIAQSQRLGDIPDLSDFFYIFNNSDSFFLSRSRWSSHP